MFFCGFAWMNCGVLCPSTWHSHHEPPIVHCHDTPIPSLPSTDPLSVAEQKGQGCSPPSAEAALQSDQSSTTLALATFLTCKSAWGSHTYVALPYSISYTHMHQCNRRRAVDPGTAKRAMVCKLSTIVQIGKWLQVHSPFYFWPKMQWATWVDARFCGMQHTWSSPRHESVPKEL